MKRSLLVTPLLSAALLAPAAPALAAAPSPASTQATSAPAVTTAADAQAALAIVDARIAQLKATPAATVPQVNYSQEVTKLLQTALELRGVIETIASGGVPMFDISTIQPRVQLLVTISQTIADATTQLTTKVDAAHVELGFSITRAVLRLVNPTATAAMIAESQKDVTDTYTTVSTYPDLTPTDRATIYVKGSLDSVIWQTRFDRDAHLLGKDPVGYAAVNRALTHAVGVWFNPTATVGQVTQEIAALQAAYRTAAGTTQPSAN